MVVIRVDVVAEDEVVIAIAHLNRATEIPALEPRIKLQRMSVAKVK